MSLAKFVLLIPILAACMTKHTGNSPIHTNSYYSIYNKMTSVDSIVAVDRKGKQKAYAREQKGIGEYPGLYKDRLVSLVRGREYLNLVTFNLVTHQIDTLCSEIGFLTTSSIDEYDGILLIRDYDSYGIVDVEKKELLKQSQCYLENILLVGSDYYLVRTLNDTSEPKLYLCKGSITGTKDIKLVDIPGMYVQHYTDATTNGWNGMAICQGILFIHAMDRILAYDIHTNRTISEIEESQETITYKSAKSKNPVFLFGKEKIVFDMKKKSFKRI